VKYEGGIPEKKQRPIMAEGPQTHPGTGANEHASDKACLRSGCSHARHSCAVVDEDPERATEEFAPYFHHVASMYGVWLGEEQYGNIVEVDEAPKQMSLEDFKKSKQMFVLTPAEAIQFFKTMAEKVPVEHVTIAVPPRVPLSKYAKHAELLAKEVLPAFA
jgi:hypothetical protein